MELEIFEPLGRHGNLRVKLDANPTRTLAHLIAAYGAEPNFPDTIAALTSAEFFARAGGGAIPPSLDRNDNWLPSVRAIREVWGPGFFDAFLELFVRKLQQLVLDQVTSSPSEPVFAEAHDHVVTGEDGRITIRWGDVRVSLIETYFERFHYAAVAAVRVAGHSLLTRDHRIALQHYTRDMMWEREGDCFRVLLQVSATRKLVVYAKRLNRIRFEVRRDGRGRYPATEIADPTARLLAIIRHERDEAEDAVHWDAVGAQFSDLDVADLSDLLNLVDAVALASGSAHQTVLRLLLTDGGISLSTPGIDQSTITRLRMAGVIDRVRIRRPELRKADPRYALVEPYHEVREAILRAFSPAADDEDLEV